MMNIRIIEDTPWLEDKIIEAFKQFCSNMNYMGRSVNFQREYDTCKLTIESFHRSEREIAKVIVTTENERFLITPSNLGNVDEWALSQLLDFVKQVNTTIEIAENAERLADRDKIFKDYGIIRETIDIAWNACSNDNLVQLSYSLDEIMERGCSLDSYIKILEYMIANGFDEIVDIGIAYGWQAKMFLSNDIKYTGVDRFNRLIVYKNKPNFSFIHGTYPNVDILKQGNKTLGVAILSLGWGMFDEDISLVVDKLRDDFNTAIVYAQKDFIEECSKYFDVCDMGKDDWNRNLKLLKRKRQDDGLFKVGKVGR